MEKSICDIYRFLRYCANDKCIMTDRSLLSFQPSRDYGYDKSKFNFTCADWN